MLEEAVLYDVARRVGLEKPLSALSDGWAEEVWWQKMRARYHVGPEIAAIAQRCCVVGEIQSLFKKDWGMQVSRPPFLPIGM